MSQWRELRLFIKQPLFCLYCLAAWVLVWSSKTITAWHLAWELGHVTRAGHHYVISCWCQFKGLSMLVYIFSEAASWASWNIHMCRASTRREYYSEVIRSRNTLRLWDQICLAIQYCTIRYDTYRINTRPWPIFEPQNDGDRVVWVLFHGLHQERSS